MSKPLVITISFQQSEKWLYDLLSTKSSMSGTVKDILKDYYEGSAVSDISQNKEPCNKGISSILDSFDILGD